MGAPLVMNKFTIGDHVRIIATPSRWFDLVGRVEMEAEGQFRVVGEDFGPLWFYPAELVLADPAAFYAGSDDSGAAEGAGVPSGVSEAGRGAWGE